MSVNNPTPSQVHVNRPLTQFSEAYIQSVDDFVAHRVFPVIKVTHKSDVFYKYDKGDWFSDRAQKRAPGTESAGTGYNVTTDSYLAEVWALHRDIPWEERNNQDAPPLQADRDTARFLTQQMLIRRDRLWVSRFFKEGVWATDLVGVGSAPGPGEFLRWNAEGSTPIDDIAEAREAIKERTGYWPNKLTVSPAVHRVLRTHPQITELHKYTSGGAVSREILARLFEVDEYLVASGVVNTAPAGAAASVSFIAGKHALLTYSPLTPAIMEPSAGYTFAWTGYLGANAFGGAISTFDIRERKATRMEIEIAQDQKLVAADLGAFFKDAVGEIDEET